MNSEECSKLIITDADCNGLVYVGMSQPFGVTIDGKRYIVKDEQFASSVYSEYIASRFIKNLGLPAQKVMLGEYHGRVVAVIEDFVHAGYSFYPFEHNAQSEMQNVFVGSFYSFDDIDNIIQSFHIEDYRFVASVKEFFDDMFICDAIIGNSDRNNGNWGFLKREQFYRIAPIYDNANSLIAMASESSLKSFYRDKKHFVVQRAVKLPLSLVGMNIDGKFVRDFRVICSHLDHTAFRDSLNDVKVAEAIKESVKGVPSDIAEICRYIVNFRYNYVVIGRSIEDAYRRAEESSC